MIIIVEGADGSGKSHLAAQLSAQLNFPIIHNSYPKTDEDFQNMFQMYKQTLQTCNNMIFDRCWYSEMTYGPVIRGKSAISQEQMLELEEIVIQCGGGIIIHCTGSSSTLWSRCKLRGEDYVTTQTIFNAIYHNYNRIFGGTTELWPSLHLIPVLQYEYIPIN